MSNIDDRIKYLKDKIIKQYGSSENFNKIVKTRTYDKTIIEKLGSDK